jgi:hypothetical protein
MANTLNDREALDGGNREDDVITEAEFRTLQRET